MGDTPFSDDHLPDSVEAAIGRICLEKDQPPLKTYARKMLAKIGEQPALDLLLTVLNASSIRSFGGFVSHLVKEHYPVHHESALLECGYSSPQASPQSHNMRSPPSSSPPGPNDCLPDSVEAVIRRICLEKDQLPLKPYARKMLAKIGEQPALDLLRRVLNASSIWSFGGFVSHLVKEHHPVHHESALLECGCSLPQASPQPQNMSSPPSSSPRSPNAESVGSPMLSSSFLRRTSPQNCVSRQLCFENGNLGKRSVNAREQSSCNGEHRKVAEPTTTSQQLMILSKLE